MAKRCVIFDVQTGDAVCSLSSRRGRATSEREHIAAFVDAQLGVLASKFPGREFVACEVHTPKGRDEEILHRGLGRIRATLHVAPAGHIEIGEVSFAPSGRFNEARTKVIPRFTDRAFHQRPRILKRSAATGGA